ncbi:MAG: membrane protein insertase YidC [Oscillospiraceae bacterium]|nr:membrane protein insertase YidC [Oscillospiraceae bacterium]
MSTINLIYRAMGAALLFFYNAFNSYGWAILAFGLVVKLIMLPFQMKSKHSMMRTTMLTPRVKELEKKYATNKQKYQEEVARLYKDAKVNPMSGCLWTLIPFPILILLYQAVRQPLSYLMSLVADEIATLTEVVTNLGLYTAPARTDAYAQMTIANLLHEHFQTIVSNSGVAAFAEKLKDINFSFLTMNLTKKPWGIWSEFDTSAGVKGWLPVILMLLIPFLSAGLTVLQTKLSMKMNPAQDEKSAQTTKSMNMIMPVMSVYICFIMPVAMGLYWIEQSVLGIIQEALLNKYYKNKLDAEMADFIAAEKAREEELERKRAETERLKAEGKTQVNTNTSKKRLAAQERNAEEQRLAAIRAAERAAKGLEKEVPDSQVGNRPFARGRAYVADRYPDEPEEVPVPAEDVPAEAEEIPAEVPAEAAEAADASVDENKE